MDTHTQTIKVYQDKAEALAAKFDALPTRTKHIEETFRLLNKSNPLVVEIGCGTGKDAQLILQHTDNYFGFDVSQGLLNIARVKCPNATFFVADAISFVFPNNIDILFAFASLIHLNKEQLGALFKKLFIALNPSGILRLSLKYDKKYKEFTRQDEFGTRTYYYYSDKEILALAKGFKVLTKEIEHFQDQNWIELTLQKPA
ncbi:class I SAM-dependent methyltransferase [Candidatus Woesearchaeota archaeon]|nr:class I SAM-dependent methyltransferase [Candidatus Woesearchaeota archaeon]